MKNQSVALSLWSLKSEDKKFLMLQCLLFSQFFILGVILPYMAFARI